MKIQKIAIGLAAMFVLALVAVLFMAGPAPAKFASILSGSMVLFGAVTVTYQFPVAGTVAPAANQQPLLNTVRGTVTATDDADTTATITHNMGLTAGQLAAGQPELTLIPLKTNFYTSTWIAAYTDGNTITLTKGTGGGSGVADAQLGFIIRRPHSIAI
jgi:hypothetical protein